MAPTTKSGRGLGWVADSPDQRDLDASLLLGLAHARAPLPASVDLRTSPAIPPVYDQGNLGSCTANSIAANLEFAANLDGHGAGTPSRLFIYYHERLLEGTVDKDAGAMIRDGFKVIASTGAPPETDWPYDISKFTLAPPPVAEKDAAAHKALKYYRVKTRDGILDALAAGYLVSFGFTVFESFEEVGSDGIVAMPEQGEQMLGGHAVVAAGYDLAKKLMLVRNSWGTGWGLGGYCWMPFEYWNRDYCSDFWCCEAAS